MIIIITVTIITMIVTITISTTIIIALTITKFEFRQAPILEMALDRFTANYQGHAWAAAGSCKFFCENIINSFVVRAF